MSADPATIEGVVVDLFVEGEGVELFPGDEYPEDTPSRTQTIDWITSFDEDCRDTDWRKWRDKTDQCFDYFRGKQKDVKKSGVYFVVFNIIRMRILTKNGILTGAKPTASIQGVEIEDELASQALDDLISFFSTKLDFDIKLADASLDSLMCGLGALELHWDYGKKRYNGRRGWIRGNFVLTREDPRAYAFPKHGDERLIGDDGSSGLDGYTKEYWIRRRKLEAMYPQASDLIKNLKASSKTSTKKRTRGSADSESGAGGSDSRNDEIRVVEAWYFKEVPVKVILEVSEDGTERPAVVKQFDKNVGKFVPTKESEPLEDAEAAQAQYEAESEVGDVTHRYRVHTDTERKLWWGAVAGDKVLLFNRPGPYRHGFWPTIFVPGMLDHNEAMPYGDVEHLVEGQNVVNSVVSLILDNMSRTNNQGKIIDTSMLKPKYKKNAVRRIAKAGYVLEAVAGKADKVVWRDEAQPLDQSALTIVNWVVSLFDQMSSVADIQSGKMDYATSGRGIRELVGAADTALDHLKTNLTCAIRHFGRLLLSMIQQFVTIEDKIRISKDYREYTLGFEWFTDPENMDKGTRMSLALYDNDNPKENPRIIDDLETMQFDIEVNVDTNLERDPAEKRETAEFALKNGIATPEYWAKEWGIPRSEFRRAQKWQEMEKIRLMQEEMEKDEVMGPVFKLMTNPETLGAVKAAMAPIVPQLLEMTGQGGGPEDPPAPGAPVPPAPAGPGAPASGGAPPMKQAA